MRPAHGRTRLAALCAALLVSPLMAAPRDEPVVLLHGLARSATSMAPLERTLRRAGYPVCNVDYPSREHVVADLARDHVAPAIHRCFPDHHGPVHFVTHSLGGLVARELVASGRVPAGRVVMLGPPNHGSEVVSALGDQWWFRRVAGPAGQELRPRQDVGTPGALPWALGIIAGDRSVNPFLSLLLPGADDGKVTVASARMPGMADFLVLPVSHPLLMRNREVQRQTLHFLAQGRFAHEATRVDGRGAAELAAKGSQD